MKLKDRIGTVCNGWEVLQLDTVKTRKVNRNSTSFMSKYLGRKIEKGEEIHHRNGIRDDNRLENLELWTKKHPPGQRVKDVYEFCLSYIEKYKNCYHKIIESESNA